MKKPCEGKWVWCCTQCGGQQSDEKECHSGLHEPPTAEAGDSYKEAIVQNLKLRKALEQCVRVAQAWHGDDAFDIYFNHSPEMKLIREALGKMPDPTEE